MRAAFRRLMTQTVVLESYTGPDENGGAPLFDTSTLLTLCRVEPRNRAIRRGDGSEVISTALVCVGDDGAIVKPDDQLTLPDGTARQVVEVAKLYDTDGTIHHLEVAVL